MSPIGGGNQRAPITDHEFMDALNNDNLHLFDMTYENSYIHHQNEEIDYDVIFGRKHHTSKPVKRRNNHRSKGIIGPLSESTKLNEDHDPNNEAGLVTEVPYVVFKVSDPNMRSIDEYYLKVMNYSNWTETKFFKSDQIQEVISTEYPDRAWTIDYYNRRFLMEDINSTFGKMIDSEAETSGFDLKLLIETKFVRNSPTEAKIAVGN